MIEEFVVEHEEGPVRGRYVIHLPDGLEAELTYGRRDTATLVADHTYVPPSFRGHGLAEKLVNRLIADMREHHANFLPPSLKDLRVESGGYGAGTTYRVTGVFLGGERELHMRVEEPEPGRVLTVSHLDSPLVTTWTI